MPDTPIIAAHHVNLWYNKTHALQDISIDIRRTK